MSRMLANGVATKILIEGNYGYNITENKDKILEQLKKYIDLDCYNSEEEDNSIYFEIKPEIVDENIHDLIKETKDTLHYCSILDYFGIKDISDIKDFNKKKYPLKLIYDTEREKFKLTIPESNYEKYEDIAAFQNFSYMLLDSDLPCNKIDISIWFIPIWIECDIYDDEYEILRLLTIFSNNYFKNKLFKCSLFYILG